MTSRLRRETHRESVRHGNAEPGSKAASAHPFRAKTCLRRAARPAVTRNQRDGRTTTRGAGRDFTVERRMTPGAVKFPSERAEQVDLSANRRGSRVPPIPRPPKAAKAEGRRLWRAVLADYELEEHELALLRQAVAAADHCTALRDIVEQDGPIVASPQGDKAHPALVELRQQQVTLARLLAALRVPLGEEGSGAKTSPSPRLQRRSGARGVYGIGGAA